MICVLTGAIKESVAMRRMPGVACPEEPLWARKARKSFCETLSKYRKPFLGWVLLNGD